MFYPFCLFKSQFLTVKLKFPLTLFFNTHFQSFFNFQIFRLLSKLHRASSINYTINLSSFWKFMLIFVAKNVQKVVFFLYAFIVRQFSVIISIQRFSKNKLIKCRLLALIIQQFWVVFENLCRFLLPKCTKSHVFLSAFIFWLVSIIISI